MEDVAECEVAEWPRGESMALHPRLLGLTLEMILRAVFGLESGPRLEALRSGPVPASKRRRSGTRR